MKDTRGVEIMRRIQSGELKKLPTDYVAKIRTEITEALEELLDFGARIRPLILDGKRVGWCRGIHLSERKVLQRWSMDLPEFAENIVKLGTTLPQEYIDGMSGSEMQGLIRLLKEMADYDLSLFPFLYAFSTTTPSYRLWCSRGQQIAGFENRIIPLPDKSDMKILVPSDHARFWSTLCVQHDKAVNRVEASMNAALVVRSFVGKNADGLTTELKNNARALMFDNPEPWSNVVRLDKAVPADDGWAHADDSLEGLQRELAGMISNDRHERLIAAFEEQQKQQSTDRLEAAAKRVEERGGPGIVKETVEILTDAEVEARGKKLRKGKPPVTPRNKRDQGDDPGDPRERIKKYK
jgi:hypothetical protein